MVGYYQGDIIPSPDVVMVFGSNPEGRHGAGAAKVARERFGAEYGVGEGLTGNAYALPTKDLRVRENKGYRSISPEAITESVKKLYQVARENPGKNFCVAYRNTDQRSLNGYTGYEMMDMFLAAGQAPANVFFSKEWADSEHLGPAANRPLTFSARTAGNSYEVSSRGDRRFSAFNVRFAEGTVIDGEDVSGWSVEEVYQRVIKRSGKGLAPASDSRLSVLYRGYATRDGNPAADLDATVAGAAPDYVEGFGAKYHFTTDREEAEGYAKLHSEKTNDLGPVSRENKGYMGDYPVVGTYALSGRARIARFEDVRDYDLHPGRAEGADVVVLKRGTLSSRSSEFIVREGAKDLVLPLEKADRKILEDFSFGEGYLPLWQIWAEQNHALMADLREKSAGKVLTDQFASTGVSQARALALILNEEMKETIKKNNSIMTQEEKDTLVRDIERNYVNIRSVRRNYASFIPERIEQTIQYWLEDESVFAVDLFQYSDRELPVADILKRYESLSDTEREALPIEALVRAELDSLAADRNKEDEVRSIIEEYFHGGRTLGDTEDRLVEFFSRSGISPSDANSIMGTASEDIRTGEAPHGTTLFDDVFSTLIRNFAETITRYSSEIARIRAESPELRFDDTGRVPEMDWPKRSAAFILRQYVTLDDRTKARLALDPATKQDLDFIHNISSVRFALECSIRDAQKDIERVHDDYFNTIFSFEEMEAKRVALEAENPFVERLPEIRVAEILPGYSEWGTLQGTALDIPETVELALDDLLQQTQYSTEILTALQLASSDKEAATKALLAVKDRGFYELSDDFLLRSVDYLSKTLNVGRGFAEEFIRERTPKAASKSNIELPFPGEETDEQNKVIQQNNDTMAQENENTSAPSEIKASHLILDGRDSHVPNTTEVESLELRNGATEEQAKNVTVLPSMTTREINEYFSGKDEFDFTSPEQAYAFAKCFYTAMDQSQRLELRDKILATEDVGQLRSLLVFLSPMRNEWESTKEHVCRSIAGDEFEQNGTPMKEVLSCLSAFDKEPSLLVSYFGSRNLPKDSLLVQISTSAPKGMEDKIAFEFESAYPDYKTMVGPYRDGKIDNAEYSRRYYNDVLVAKADKIKSGIKTIMDEARAQGKDVVLLCYEKAGTFCHRYLLSNFLNEQGISCAEIDKDRATYLSGAVALFGEDGYKPLAEQFKSVSLQKAVGNVDLPISFSESSGNYAQRTRENAQSPDVDFTLAIAKDFTTFGEKCTAKAAGDSLIACQVNDLSSVSSVVNFIFDSLPEEFQKGQPLGLNIAGNGLYTLQQDQDVVDHFMVSVLSGLQAKGVRFESIRSGGQTGMDEAGAYAGVCLGVPVTVHAPKGFLMRDRDGKNIAGREAFISRFERKDYAAGKSLAEKVKKDYAKTAKKSFAPKK